MKRRYLWYLLAAISFGVFDLLYETYPIFGAPAYLTMLIRTWLVWLVLVIPIAIIETKVANDLERTILASTLSSMMAIETFYLAIFFKLVFFGSKTANSYHIYNFQKPRYFTNLFLLLHNQILQSLEWLVVASISGIILSFLVFTIFKKPIPTGRHEKKAS